MQKQSGNKHAVIQLIEEFLATISIAELTDPTDIDPKIHKDWRYFEREWEDDGVPMTQWICMFDNVATKYFRLYESVFGSITQRNQNIHISESTVQKVVDDCTARYVCINNRVVYTRHTRKFQS